MIFISSFLIYRQCIYLCYLIILAGNDDKMLNIYDDSINQLKRKPYFRKKPYDLRLLCLFHAYC